MCKARQRLAGVIKSGDIAKRHLPGYSGFLKVQYTGQVERAQLPTSLFSGLEYVYGTSKPVLFVDARDVGRVLAWTENGQPVFVVANKGDEAWL